MQPKTGILLINLGTPDAPDKESVRRYLKEFLSDPRVIERGGIWWWLILNGIILPRRAKTSAHAYGLIWNRELDESPLRTFTRSQAGKLAERFARNGDILVDWAMRYGTPSLERSILRLTEAGCDRILLFPLYPQYSGATTATAMDKVFECLGKMRSQPSVRTVAPYYAAPDYIDAVGQSITAHIATLGWTPDMVVASFHGLPESFIRDGDPYQSQCEETTRLLRASLRMTGDAMPLVYQSRGGRAEWIGPLLDETLAELAGRGVKNLCVVTPGFASDCIETLEEVQFRAAETFLGHGGQNFSLVPCLNDSDASLDMIYRLTSSNLGGWL